MEHPVQLELQPSRLLLGLLAALHLAALGSLVPLALPWWLKLAGAAIIAASAVAAIRRHALLAAPVSVYELALGADGSVVAGRRDGGRLTASVSPRSTGFPWLVVVLLAAPGARRLLPVVILPDALPAQEFRSLRSWLRWVARPEANAA